MGHHLRWRTGSTSQDMLVIAKDDAVYVRPFLEAFRYQNGVTTVLYGKMKAIIPQ
jgi:hypothetical protein